MGIHDLLPGFHQRIHIGNRQAKAGLSQRAFEEAP